MTREEIQVVAYRFNELHRGESWFLTSTASRTKEGKGTPCLRVIVRTKADAEKVESTFEDVPVEVTIASETALF